ncbi:hypothetical protein [Trebonia kvetii]|nr:hypothetical protein [Trebonia kvetii]
MSIGDIAERIPGVPRTSACPHLTGLEAAGIVRRVTGYHHLLFPSCG